MCATYAPRDPVGEYWRGELSLRSLRVLIEGLPPDSAMHRKYPQSRGWDTKEYLTADLVDAVQSLFNLTLAANTEAGTYEPPEPYARPGDAERRVVTRRRAAKDEASMRSVLEQILPPERR